jgi:hypothetical protein
MTGSDAHAWKSPAGSLEKIWIGPTEWMPQCREQ